MDVKYMPLVPFVLVLWHFLCDWVYQSHAEALAKARDHKVRFWHCVKYAVPFVPLLWYFGMEQAQIWLSLAILFCSHFIIDTYIPVMLWAKYLRRAPEFNVISGDMEAFKAFATTPLGLILLITMDQFLHIACLLPIAVMAMR